MAKEKGLGRMNDGLPSLAGEQRAMNQDFNWACATFTWAFGELRRLQNLATARPSDVRLRDAAADTAAAISEQLENWEPSHQPN
jgi:hypothetical protein